MRILWHSNSPLVATGYGNQTALFTPRLSPPHTVAISSFYGLEGAPIMWESQGVQIPVFAGLGGEYGNQYIAGHASAFFGGNPKAGLVLTLMDVLALDAKVYSKLNTACWTPVDHDPATPAQQNFFTQTSAFPIAMSEYGADRLSEFKPYYVPHGVDTNVFAPQGKPKIREQQGIPKDAFVVGIVAANKGNPSRKCFVESLQAFARLRERHENALLYLHSEISGVVGQGVPLIEVAVALGIPQEAITRVDQYRLLFSAHPPEELAEIYSVFDVLLNPSAGEGFGITQMEAQACGVPVIGSNFAASKEVIGSGWLVNGQKFWTGQRSFQRMPFVDEIYEALEECYGLSTEERMEYADKARSHAVKYDVRKVARDYMLPVLAEIEERLGEQPDLNGGGTDGEVQERIGITGDHLHPGQGGADLPGGAEGVRDHGQGDDRGAEVARRGGLGEEPGGEEGGGDAQVGEEGRADLDLDADPDPGKERDASGAETKGAR